MQAQEETCFCVVIHHDDNGGFKIVRLIKQALLCQSVPSANSFVHIADKNWFKWCYFRDMRAQSKDYAAPLGIACIITR